MAAIISGSKSLMTTIEGGCHCGNIRWRFTPARPLAELPVRRCTCSFCTKHGALYSSDPDGQLSVEIRRAEDLSVYQFATRATEPQVCRRCGVLPLILARIDGQLCAVVNLATADGFVIAAERIEDVSFEHETAAERNARRARKWTAQVRVVERDDEKAGPATPGD